MQITILNAIDMASITFFAGIPVFVNEPQPAPARAKAAHTDLPRLSDKKLELELQYLVAHQKEIGQNIAVSVIRCIDGQTLELPFWALSEDQLAVLERIEAIVEELRSRRIP